MSSEAQTETLAQRMKFAEHEYRRKVEPSDYLLMRLDGRAFHTYTRGLDRPFDASFAAAMDHTAEALCAEISGAQLAYTQSDEISLLITNCRLDGEGRVKIRDPWMGGVESKMLSLAASIATESFNSFRGSQGFERGAHFDARLWTFPATEEGRSEVLNYFVWRRRDAVKNSITMAASAHFSHARLLHVNSDEKLVMLEGIGSSWTDQPAGFRYGRLTAREVVKGEVTYIDKRNDQPRTISVVRRPFVSRAVSPNFHEIESLIPQPDGSTL